MEIFTSIFNPNSMSRIRRNHGLEHATLNVLTSRHARLNLAGHSDHNGFWIIGEVPTEAVEEAVFQALTRMQAGEHDLAIHANCGTNFVAAGIIAGLTAWVSMLGSGRKLGQKLERLPLVISLTTLALVLTQPLGPLLQARVTTSGEPGDLKIKEIIVTNQGPFKAHHVLTQG
jgi:hypothetical protein